MKIHKKTLELEKILKVLAAKVEAEDAKNKILSIEPATDIAVVQRRLDETLEAHALIARYKSPSFDGLKNIDDILSRVNSGGTLAAHDLLKVAGVLNVFDSIFDFRKTFKNSATILDDKFDAICTNRTLKKRICTSIISDDEIADEASPESSIKLFIRRRFKNVCRTPLLPCARVDLSFRLSRNLRQACRASYTTHLLRERPFL